MNVHQLLWSTWHWHPAVLAGCAAAVIAYGLIWQSAARSLALVSAPGKAALSAKAPYRGGGLSALYPGVAQYLSRFPRKLAFLMLALVVFVLTLESPLETLAEGYLFSAHMLQHLLLLLIVPALLLLALPDDRAGKPPSFSTKNTAGGTPGLSSRARILRPLAGWISGVGAMWFWHIPVLCDAATMIPSVRVAQTVSLLVLGCFFWWPILGPRAAHRLSLLPGVTYLFTACTGCTLLGIIITFVPVSVCPVYLHPKDPLDLLPLIRSDWGITPAVDQQVGGLLMWVPACMIYLSGIMGMLWRWYNQTDANLPELASTTQSA